DSNGDGGSAPEPDPAARPPPNASPSISRKAAGPAAAGPRYRYAPRAAGAADGAAAFPSPDRPGRAAVGPAAREPGGTRLDPGGRRQEADARTSSNLGPRVSDGDATAQLPAFSTAVESIGLGSATLTWVAPTLRTDGTLLDDLAGYKVYWGTESRNYTESIQIDNPGVTTYVVENLGPGTHYFATTALSSDGLESDYSNEASNTIP